MAGWILVVEDDDLIRGVIAASLEDEGYRVQVAASSREMSSVFAGNMPDLVLLDLALPEEDGLSICRKLRAMPEGRDVPVVFISAMTQPMYVQAAAQAGGSGFIRKPFEIEQLLSTVARFSGSADSKGTSIIPLISL